MKHFNYFIVVVMVSIMATSCVEKSSKYQTLLNQRDSLSLVTKSLEDSYNETLDIINEIEAGFQEIRATEGKVALDVNTIEGQSQNRKQEIVTEVSQIKNLIEKNKKRIAQLESQLKQSGKKNATLTETIKRMESEIQEKSATIASLQDQLNKKNIKIDELNQTVGTLTADVDNLNKTSTELRDSISQQDIAMNTVWYCVATSSELKEANIISKKLFVKTILNKDFNKDAFHQIDMRKLPFIFLDAKKATILSNHPEGSYTIVKGEDGKLTLFIDNPTSFWSITKYLVAKVVR